MVTSGQKKVAVVIGAGVGGLAAAIRLALKGYQCTIFEANSTPGGKISEIREAGYRFDLGPSLFTLPRLVDELFKLAGKNPRDYFSYQKLDLITRYHYEDGTLINAWADPEDFAREIELQTGEPAIQVRKFLARSQKQFELTGKLFLQSSLHKFDTYSQPGALKTLLNLPSLDTHKTMSSAIAKAFQDARVRQLFNRYATYNGSDPYRAPGTLNVIPHLEHNLGAFYAEGGMRSIALALVRLAEELGVEIRLNSRVEAILTEGKRVKGVKVGEVDFQAEVVISNMDVVPTYRKLLPGHKAPERTLRQERSSSALIFYWGMEGDFPELDLHNIFFSDDYRGEFKALFGQKSLFPDPTVYLYISSKRNPSDAPPGHENWFTMINAPHLNGQDWDKLVPMAREAILIKLSRMLGREIEPKIRFERILDPRGIEKNTSSHLGALYGGSSNNPFAAFLRHPNFSTRLKGLYFVGGSVHPGGGIPLCLLSAQIATREIP
ncbi:MAG: phytoene desaturase [Bacteroidia bacterium]|nr:phytoene desaturase [Bacteroidia bacterium]